MNLCKTKITCEHPPNRLGKRLDTFLHFFSHSTHCTKWLVYNHIIISSFSCFLFVYSPFSPFSLSAAFFFEPSSLRVHYAPTPLSVVRQCSHDQFLFQPSTHFDLVITQFHFPLLQLFLFLRLTASVFLRSPLYRRSETSSLHCPYNGLTCTRAHCATKPRALHAPAHGREYEKK